MLEIWKMRIRLWKKYAGKKENGTGLDRQVM